MASEQKQASDALFATYDLDSNQMVSFVELEKGLAKAGKNVDLEKLNEEFGLRRNIDDFYLFYKQHPSLFGAGSLNPSESKESGVLEAPSDDQPPVDASKPVKESLKFELPNPSADANAISGTASFAAAGGATMAAAAAVSAHPFSIVHMIGGGGGGPVQLYGGYNGAMLQKIGVWAGKKTINSVKIWLTNGEIGHWGHTNGPYREFTFAPGELMTRCSLWGNGIGTRTGKIWFTTNKGNSFSHQMTKWKTRQEYPIDIGSGLCVGVMARAGHEIDMFGFVFVKPIRQSEMVHVRYPTIGFEDANVVINTLDNIPYINNTSVQQTYTLTRSVKTSTRVSWSITTGIEATVSAKITAGVPKVGTVEGGFSLTMSASATYTREQTKEVTNTWTFPVTVPANKTVNANLSIGRADISLPYTAQIRVTTTDGAVLAFNTKGTYEGVSYTTVKMSLT